MTSIVGIIVIVFGVQYLLKVKYSQDLSLNSFQDQIDGYNEQFELDSYCKRNYGKLDCTKISVKEAIDTYYDTFVEMSEIKMGCDSIFTGPPEIQITFDINYTDAIKWDLFPVLDHPESTDCKYKLNSTTKLAFY